MAEGGVPDQRAPRMRRGGFVEGHLFLLYRLEGLNLRLRWPRRKRAAYVRVPLPVPVAPNQQWTMDFVTDQLFDGRRFRMLTVVDKFSRECVLMEADFSLTGRKVARALEQVGQE